MVKYIEKTMKEIEVLGETYIVYDVCEDEFEKEYEVDVDGKWILISEEKTRGYREEAFRMAYTEAMSYESGSEILTAEVLDGASAEWAYEAEAMIDEAVASYMEWDEFKEERCLDSDKDIFESDSNSIVVFCSKEPKYTFFAA